jgi:hypothetical protein
MTASVDDFKLIGNGDKIYLVNFFSNNLATFDGRLMRFVFRFFANYQQKFLKKVFKFE